MDLEKPEGMKEEVIEDTQDEESSQPEEKLSWMSDHALEKLLNETDAEHKAPFNGVKDSKYEERKYTSLISKIFEESLDFEEPFSEEEEGEGTCDEMFEESISSEKGEEEEREDKKEEEGKEEDQVEEQKILKLEEGSIDWNEQHLSNEVSETPSALNNLTEDKTTSESPITDTYEDEVEEESGLSEQLSEEEDEKVVQYLMKLDELLGHPHDPDELPEEKLKRYINVIKELEDTEKDIDKMLNQLENDYKMLNIMDISLDPMIRYYEKVINVFDKVDTSFLEGTEELEEADEATMERAKEMARQVLEAEEVDSIGSSGKESTDEELLATINKVEKEMAELDNQGKTKEKPLLRKNVASKPRKEASVKKGKAQKGKKTSVKLPKKGKKR